MIFTRFSIFLYVFFILLLFVFFQSFEEREILTEYIVEATNDEAAFDSHNLTFKGETTDRRVVVGLKHESEKILIPILSAGPNNQLQGFRESIYFAKTLGRSLAVPVFFPNWNQKGLPGTIDASMRLDIHSLSEYVHLIDPKDVSRLCDGVATAVLKTRNDEDYPHKISALDFYDIEIAKNAKNFSTNNESYKEGKFIDGIDKEKIKEYFSTDEKCAILFFPWNTIDSEEISNQMLFDKGKRDERYNEIEQIFKHTKRPVYVQEATANFLRENDIEKFAVLHWRYDEADYFRNALPKKREAMALIKEIKETTFALESFALELSSLIEEKNISYVYFACPPGEKEFLKSVSDKMVNLKIIDDNKLADFLKLQFKNTPEIMEDYDDLLSLVEMELSFLSSYFVYSCYSTWR